MIKLKSIARLFTCITSVLVLSAYTVTENPIITKQKKQSVSEVSGIYEFQTSWLQSTANFKPDGTFEMSYSIGEKHTTSGTWTIKKDILILKNDDNFPANKKWLIRNDKLYPILKSAKEYDMNFFYTAKKQTVEKANCAVLKNCRLRYSEANDDSTYITIKDNVFMEFPNADKEYIKSNLEWVNECEYNATVTELTASGLNFKTGDKINVKIDKIDNDMIYYTASFEGQTVTGKFIIMK
ncbi:MULTISPECIES: hypothetical protein [Flavobacterium]|uniref:Lipocalin-like domain-containing protein n=1 Tax=Flavobacterium defluvii TaxID=370979 RepID=A0A1M5EDL8_9FLAO|nr:hypothetical protein [Flavobacterium defluvii]SHF77286.1 hypothetical protein SAMN05443663_101104 [Flavobacterium defluvii]